MGNFVNQVRQAKVKAPNTRDWTEDTWACDFSKIATPDAADQAVFEAGKWFGRKLSSCWVDIENMNFRKYDRLEFYSKMMISLNGAAERVFLSYNDQRNEYFDDYILSAVGDTLNRFLRYFHEISDFGDEEIDDACLDHCLSLFNGIYLYEFMWGRVLWSNWGLIHTDADVELVPITTEAQRMLDYEAVAEYLRQQEAAQMHMLYAAEWDAGHHRDIAPPIIRLIKYQVPRAAFAVEARPPAAMPPYLPNLLSHFQEWLAPMVMKPVAVLDGIGLIEVVRSWLLLFHAVKEILGAGEFGLIHIDDAVGLISRINSRISRATARKIVDFLVFDPSETKGDGVWGAPFVRLSESILCPVIPSLLHPNIQRMVDLWGERCIQEHLLTFRGGLWEQHVRTSLIEGFQENDWDSDFWVQTTDLKRWGHQIDILFRVGRLVVVGETKFTKYPCIPAEFGRFFEETLDYAAIQVEVRRQALENNRKDLARLSKFKGDPKSMIIIPIVVSPHFLGSGVKIRGVDCVSFDDIQHFFVSDHLPLGTLSTRMADALGKLRFRKEGERIEEAFLRYLKHPPQAFLYNCAVERMESRFPDPQTLGLGLRWSAGMVRVPQDRTDFAAFAKAVEERWNTEVLNEPQLLSREIVDKL